ncbi:hypothetical protein IQ279_04510 [Streptomyces verrucosisporus]|uniref:DUF3592 domain-containing protein n=1 Tax=Streptomyces verrucosisporus TaxID=1695161 RepID=UPI0019D00A1F|nr:DUF3592 domain-containing protein [Streptomyces verrucosisporus]MBN3928910.1 hypothetical protein [Streptomyces verrucosisporus]
MLLLLGGVASLLAVYFLQRGVRHLVFLVRERRAVKSGETTKGVCTGYQWTVNGAVIGVVRYEDSEGRVREAFTGPSARPPLRVGETAPVTYSPGNPAHRGVVNGEFRPVIVDVFDVLRFFVGTGLAAALSFVFFWTFALNS